MCIKAAGPSASAAELDRTMSQQIQTILALGIVAVAATWLVARVWAKRKNPGCGGDCACPSNDLKAKVRH